MSSVGLGIFDLALIQPNTCSAVKRVFRPPETLQLAALAIIGPPRSNSKRSWSAEGDEALHHPRLPPSHLCADASPENVLQREAPCSQVRCPDAETVGSGGRPRRLLRWSRVFPD